MTSWRFLLCIGQIVPLFLCLTVPSLRSLTSPCISRSALIDRTSFGLQLSVFVLLHDSVSNLGSDYNSLRSFETDSERLHLQPLLVWLTDEWSGWSWFCLAPNSLKRATIPDSCPDLSSALHCAVESLLIANVQLNSGQWLVLILPVGWQFLILNE